MPLFNQLRHKLAYLNSQEIESIKRAFEIANKAHKNQKRSTGKPYISHPIAVACLLADLRLDSESICAALLHDVIEDTPITKKDIQQIFGEAVANLVDGVTKLTQIKFDNTAEAQAENFRKMIMAMAKDIRVIIIKLADRLHNMRTLSSLPLQKQKRIARETLEIFAPVARRLGMREFYIELEDLAFSALYPWRYRSLKSNLEKSRKAREKTLGRINKTLRDGLHQYHVTFVDIIGREKHLYSIYRKIKSRHVPAHEIMDVYAFRIIVDDVDTCYRALGIVHRLFKPVPERFKDYIAIPKTNGYQSLHTVLFGAGGIPIEIQIRTVDMDKTATTGIAAHWIYKDQKESDQAQDLAKRWVNNLLELQNTTENPLDFIENVKVDLFPDEVYVFTPKGETLSMPGGTTAIDFAYAVHTDLGNSCVAVKIDRQLAPLSSILSNGQTIEIITAKNSRPNPAWLNFVVTSKARSNIRHYLKTQRKIEALKLGKQLFKKALANYKFSLHKIPDKALAVLLKNDQCKTLDDLFTDIGLGNRAAPLVAHQLILTMKQMVGLESEENIDASSPLIINGTEGLLVKFASCCHPIPGDTIAGIIHTGKGITVHRENCSQLSHFRDHPDKYLMLNWAEQVHGEFTVVIQIESINQPGTIAAISTILADNGANIENLIVKPMPLNHQLFLFSIAVHNRTHLAQIIQRLRRTKGILRIFRIRTEKN